MRVIANSEKMTTILGRLMPNVKTFKKKGTAPIWNPAALPTKKILAETVK